MKTDPPTSAPDRSLGMTRAWVRVSASTSNLGPGFDVLGLALDLFLVARFLPGDGPLTLERRGTLSEVSGPDKDDLVVSALMDTIGELLPKPSIRQRQNRVALLSLYVEPTSALATLTSRIRLGPMENPWARLRYASPRRH